MPGKINHVRSLTALLCLSSFPLSAQTEQDASPAPLARPLLLAQRVEADFEALWSSDILLTQSSAQYRQLWKTFQWDLAFAHNSIDLEYQPASFDFLGFDREIRENRYSLLGQARYRIHPRLEALGSAGAYDGFTDYRSLWLDTFYGQQYSALPGYVEADPQGFNFSAGVRWEYLPAAGFLQAEAAFLEDDIAPGYIFEGEELLRGRETLHTQSFILSSENILTPRLRTLNEFRLTETSQRRNRFTYQGSINLALGERWVWRNYGGVATEAPRFDAWWAGSTIEFEALPSLRLSLSGRYYRDTGEIENSLLVSDATPGVQAYQAGIGARFLWPGGSLKAFLGPYFTRYEPTGPGTLVFANLYSDRNWLLAQMAFSVEF